MKGEGHGGGRVRLPQALSRNEQSWPGVLGDSLPGKRLVNEVQIGKELLTPRSSRATLPHGDDRASPGGPVRGR